MSDAERLILCVESHPCLWDTSIEEYYDREKKDIAWLEIFYILIPNWETLSEDQKRIKGLKLKRKWCNCRDYYKNEKQKFKSKSTGSTAKKKKKYVYADILGFLDKVVTPRNHDVNYEADDTDELSGRDTEDGHEVTRNVRTRRALEYTKIENVHKNKLSSHQNTNEEPETKKKKPHNVPAEILNILKTKKNTASKDYDDDEKYLLSFSSDMKKMTHLQKIDFKLGMMQLLKDIFKENSSIYLPYCINSRTPSPQSSYTSI
ncbi:uncharacterized protein LOC119833312 [Zerene cesonia]|uniref:uncharacterized protein LOC119833312 n=1 Tax=Zerene cesonia TaxID=33412 RepID=UPI0018E58B91|nr:uncharacterized protein LOC119833312 [Zerene cesonia]